MKRLVSILSLFVLLPISPSWAQLAPPNALGVTMGQINLTVRDVEADKKFFGILGGTPIKIDGIDVMKFRGVFIFLTPGTPTIPAAHMRSEQLPQGPEVETSMIDHIGITVPDIGKVFTELRAAGFDAPAPRPGAGEAFVRSGAEGLSYEIDRGTEGGSHLHFMVPALPPKGHLHQVVPYEMFLWYRTMFGAKIAESALGSGLRWTMPGGMEALGSVTGGPSEPTKGHVVDHAGFEVKNLEAFCKKLEASGVKLTQPYSTTRHKSFASAELVDPWGMSVELTEGLSKF